MFVFANIVQKVNFERSQFRKVDIAFSKFHLFVFSLLWVLGKSFFKAPKAPLHECFCDEMFLFANLVPKIDSEQSHFQNPKVSVTRSQFLVFVVVAVVGFCCMCGGRGRNILFDESFGEIWNMIVFCCLLNTSNL